MSLNQFVAENRALARLFQAGATPVDLDSAKRVLVPKRLAEWAGIDKDCVLIGVLNKIEIWSRERYDAWLATGSLPLEQLAERVMGQQHQP
jgi:MraZ protein